MCFWDVSLVWGVFRWLYSVRWLKCLVVIGKHKQGKKDFRILLFLYVSIYLGISCPSDKTHIFQGTLFPQVSPYLIQSHPQPLICSAAFPCAKCVFTKLSGFHKFPTAHLGEIKALAIRTITKSMELNLRKRGVKNKQAKLLFWVPRKRCYVIPQE